MLEGLIGLSDEQMDEVVRNAAPLAPPDRAKFLIELAQALRDQEINDATVARACIVTRNYLASPGR